MLGAWHFSFVFSFGAAMFSAIEAFTSIEDLNEPV
jgi:hypothetical protein